MRIGREVYSRQALCNDALPASCRLLHHILARVSEVVDEDVFDIEGILSGRDNPDICAGGAVVIRIGLTGDAVDAGAIVVGAGSGGRTHTDGLPTGTGSGKAAARPADQAVETCKAAEGRRCRLAYRWRRWSRRPNGSSEAWLNRPVRDPGFSPSQ